MQAITYAFLNAIATNDSPMVLSVMAAVVTSYIALKLAGQIKLIPAYQRHLGLIGGAIAIGVGIWAMYLLAMQADLSTVLGSIGISTLLNLGLILSASALKQHKPEQTQALPHEELELRVAERTAQLSQANEQLQSKIAERQRADEEARFLQTITQAISESADFHSALDITLQNICEFAGWEFGEAWIPNSNSQKLEHSPAWYSNQNNQNVEKFRKFSEEFTFAPATGQPGRVWLSKQPEWIQDISTEPEAVVRRQLATAAGFKTGLGIPIIERDRVLAVLIFFSLESRQEDKRLVEIISTVATLLGSLMQCKRVEEALSEGEERLKAILDNSTALIYVKDTEGKYILINAWFSILFDIGKDEIKGKTDYDLFPAETAEIFQAHDQAVLKAKTPLDWEEVVLHPDGPHTYLAVKFPLYNRAGEPYAVCGISTDITERKLAEDALRSSMATNRALLNAIPDLMFRINREGIFVNFKAAKNNNLLMLKSEFLGKHLDEVLPQEVAQLTMNSVEQALQTGEVQIFECQLMADNLLDYEIRIAVSAENEVMAIVRDITERKQVEADIRTALEKEKELSELKSRFISMASHEFRTPLATILSSAELIEHYSHKWNEEKKLSHLQRIQTSVKHMTGLLNDVLLIGKAEEGKLECKPTPIDILHFCRDLVEDIELTTSSHTIAFHPQCQTTTACIDEKLLRHILSNLLSNAIKYSPAGGTVNFDLICKQEEVVFRVQDRGIGIPVADQAQLFNSFHRASNVGTISGTGLGLAIVKKSVDLHKGKIAVQSELRVGTTFTVTIPLHQQV
ncbi:MAG TPA: hypothetical protein DEV81_24445 [Cyanobacteria bacterium UBA11049]|nr:hypothetical protein [Cyanobacteria bacterium UBA11049]